MKVYISVDIESVAGITHWDEAEKTHRDYPEFREQMTREAVAAIEGAQSAGAREIWVKDAHDSGRNLITSMLPADIRLIHSWAGHPLCMVQELDESFDAVMMIGYHSAAGSEANSLAHTLSLKPHLIRLNGRITSEFYIHALAGSMLGVPTVFVSGDEGLMDSLRQAIQDVAEGKTIPWERVKKELNLDVPDRTQSSGAKDAQGHFRSPGPGENSRAARSRLPRISVRISTIYSTWPTSIFGTSPETAMNTPSTTK